MPAVNSKIEQRLDKEISRFIRRSGVTKNIFVSYKKDFTYTEFLANKILVSYTIRRGLPYSIFYLIQLYTPLSEDQWADVLDLSTKSLQRYKKSARDFRPLQSERILEISEITSIGLDVFESMEKFKLWLDTPNFALGNIKPKDLVGDSYGKELIIGELTRINYGIFA